MTLGMRIAQKRKELALSQESLGEQLGVSRQAIYKWESDSSLPEIEKLIALSKLFGVSVGVLLGVEEDAPPPQAESGALTEAQLNMVEEIVNRYLAAQPKPKPRRKWPWVLALLAVLAVSAHLFNRLDTIDRQYVNLHNSVYDVQRSVDSQINGLTGRVEEILKSQNALTAEYGAEISGANLKENRIRFSVYAVPRTYVEGMEVKFSADNHTGGINNAAGEEGFRQKFSATLAADLTDSITLSVIFIYPDGTRETQVLETYEGLLTASYPLMDIQSAIPFVMTEVPDGTLTLGDAYVSTRNESSKQFSGCPAAEIAEVQLGVFRNQKLLGWATPTEKPDSYHGSYEGEQFYRLPDLTVENLTEHDKLHVAALVTDTYGRQFMVSDIPYVVRTDTDFDTPYLTYPSDGRYDNDPANWIFE